MRKQEITRTAQEDLENVRDAATRNRIVKKLDDIRRKVVDHAIPPNKAVEKRLRKDWRPMLQQAAGDHRIWFVEGERTDRGEEDVLYVVRILSKDAQQKLKGVNINPDTFL